MFADVHTLPPHPSPSQRLRGDYPQTPCGLESVQSRHGMDVVSKFVGTATATGEVSRVSRFSFGLFFFLFFGVLGWYTAAWCFGDVVC